MKIRINQIYRSKKTDFQVIIFGRRGGKWKAKVLTDKAGVYNGTHTLSEYTIKQQYDLME